MEGEGEWEGECIEGEVDAIVKLLLSLLGVAMVMVALPLAAVVAAAVVAEDAMVKQQQQQQQQKKKTVMAKGGFEGGVFFCLRVWKRQMNTLFVSVIRYYCLSSSRQLVPDLAFFVLMGVMYLK